MKDMQKNSKDPSTPAPASSQSSLMSLAEYLDSPPAAFLRIGGEQKDRVLIPSSLPFSLNDFPEVNEMGLGRFLSSHGWDPDNSYGKQKESSEEATDSKGIFPPFSSLFD